MASGKIRVTVVLLALSLIVSCASTGMESRRQADAHYKLGVAYLGQDRIQQAYVEFQRAHDLDPHNKEVLNAIGIVYLLHFDEPAKAIKYFEKAAEEDPDYSEAYNNLGYSYQKLGKFETAIAYYKKALSNPLYPTAEKAFANMGDSYYRLGKYELAVRAFKEALKRAPGLVPAYMGLALCYNAMGRYGEASTAMTQAIKLNPAYKGNADKAAEDLREKKLSATGYEEQDIRDYLEILKY
ncbi:MAG: tetratricopeptide repeat protein [Candidatus Sulfobium sp.]